MANKIKGIIVEIGGDTVGLQKALKDVNDKAKNVSSEMREVEKALKLDPTNTELLAQKQQLLSKQTEIAKEKLSALKDVQKQVEQQFKNGDIGEEQYRAFQREVAVAEGNLKNLDSQLDNTSKTTKNLGESVEQSESKLTKFGEVAKNVGKAAADIFAALGKAAIDTGKKIWEMSNEVAAAGDSIDKTSQKIGISAESYQEWGYVFERCGANVDNLQAGMKTLSGVITEAANGSDKAKEKLAAVGLTLDDLNGKSQDEQLSIVIAKLQEMKSGAERTAAASGLLGKSAVDMAAVLNTSAEETQALKDEAHEYGMIMSNEAVAASATFEDSLTKMNHTVTGLKNNMIGALLPSITLVMDAVTDLIAGKENAGQAMDEAMTSLGNTLNNGLSEIVKKVPMFLSAAKTLVLSLVEGIIDNLPEIVKAALEVVVELAKGIVEALPELLPALVECIATITDTLTSPDMLSEILQTALDLIMALADGIVENIDELIQAAFQIIGNLIDFLLNPENIEKLHVCMMKLNIAMAQGIIKAIPEVIKGIIQLVWRMSDTIQNGDWKNLGWNIIQGIRDGLEKAWNDLTKWFSNAWNGLIDGARNILGIHSPSKVFADIGDFMALGLGEGFTKSMSAVNKDIANAIPTDFDIEPTINGSAPQKAFNGNTQTESKIVFMMNIENFYNQNKQDLDEIIEYAGNYFNAQMKRREAVF